MQRGSLLQPFAQQNSFCQGRLALEPAGCVQPSRLSQGSARTGSRPHTATGFVGLILSPLSRSTEEANPSSGRVFLSAFSPKKPHSFLRGKPRFAPLSPRPAAWRPWPHPFAPKLSRFLRLLRRGTNRASPVMYQSSGGGAVHSRAGPFKKVEPGIPAKTFCRAQLFRSRATAIPRRRAPPFGGGFGTPAAVAASPFRLPCGARFSNVWNASEVVRFLDF